VCRTPSHGCLERLEPDIGKLICPVLRGGDGGNVVSLLDTMRLTVMGQLVKGLSVNEAVRSGNDDEEALDPPTPAALAKLLESLKWNLWHGNVYRVLARVEDLEGELECLDTDTGNGKKLAKAVREFGGYIEANQAFIPNYGDRYRHGETISTAFVESTVNQVMSKRMVKKQQMRWTPRGAHLLLQVRTHVLNDELRDTFSRWYPGMEPAPQPPLKEAA
jgi:hypothetical protein